MRASDVVQRQHKKMRKESYQEGDCMLGKVSKRKMPHFRYYVASDKLVSVTSKGKEFSPTKKSGSISGNVISTLRRLEKDMNVISIWCELTLHLACSDGSSGTSIKQKLRAHEAFDKFGSFFDWVDVAFETDNASEDECTAPAPAKLLVFYEDSQGKECALVHSVEWTTGKETQLGNTRLMTNYIREFTSTGWPALQKVQLGNIHRALYAIERNTAVTGPLPERTRGRIQQKTHVVSVCKPRTEWARTFYDWAKNEIGSSDTLADNEDDSSMDSVSGSI